MGFLCNYTVANIAFTCLGAGLPVVSRCSCARMFLCFCHGRILFLNQPNPPTTLPLRQEGSLPIHAAALNGHLAAVQLLAAAPGAKPLTAADMVSVTAEIVRDSMQCVIQPKCGILLNLHTLIGSACGSTPHA